MFERYPYRRPSAWQLAARSGLFGHLGFVALAAFLGAAWFYSDHWYAGAREDSNGRMIAPGVSEVRIGNRTIQFVTAPGDGASAAGKAPSARSSRLDTSPSVVDGDTIRLRDATYRLVGFNTPETGRQAQCDRENALGRAATLRLREIVAAGSLDFEPVPCACRPNTEGTRACNYGRLCGTLKSHGRDVGTILIAEGLAHEYNCGPRGCPRRQSWCG